MRIAVSRLPFDAKAVASLKAGLGPYRASGRLQQSPSPQGGNLFDPSWWQLWEAPDGKFPPCDYIVASLDGAFTEDEENDPSALTVWGTFLNEYKQRRIILLDCWRKWVRFSAPKIPRLTEPTIIDGVRWPADDVGPGMTPELVKQRNTNYSMRSRHQWGLVEWTGHSCQRFKVNTLLIEGKASGISAAQELGNRHRGEGWSIHVLPVKGDKIARGLAAQPVFSQGLVYAPDRSWADALISEMAEFPKSKHDDLTDSATQAINHLRAIGLAQSDDETAVADAAAATPWSPRKALYPV